MANLALNDRYMTRNVWIGYIGQYYAYGNWLDLPFVYETEEEASREAKVAALRHMDLS